MVTSKRAQLQQLGPFRINLWISSRGKHQFSNLTAKVYYAKLKELSQVARQRGDTECICFDFKQNMPFPHLPPGDVFYLREVWLLCSELILQKQSKVKCTRGPRHNPSEV